MYLELVNRHFDPLERPWDPNLLFFVSAGVL